MQLDVVRVLLLAVRHGAILVQSHNNPIRRVRIELALQPPVLL